MKKVRKLPGEQMEKPEQRENPTITLDQAVAKVNDGWRKQTINLMEFAKLCKETRDATPKDQRKLLMKRVDMGRSVFNKICAIADAPYLHLPDVQNKLPGGYSLQWECAKMGEPALRAAIESGDIHPKVTRKQIHALFPPKTGKAKVKATRIDVNWSTPEYRKPSFEKWLREGADQWPSIEINWDELERLKNAESFEAESGTDHEAITLAPAVDNSTTFDVVETEDEEAFE